MAQPQPENGQLKTRKLRLFDREFELPRTRLARSVLGGLLVVGGILGFLPILGFWMIPLGLLILSHDFAVVRRIRRKMWVRFERWRAARRDQVK